MTTTFSNYHQLILPFAFYVLISIEFIHSGTSLYVQSVALFYMAIPMFPGM